MESSRSGNEMRYRAICSVAKSHLIPAEDPADYGEDFSFIMEEVYSKCDFLLEILRNFPISCQFCKELSISTLAYGFIIVN